MERVETNWLQKAVAIVAGLALAASMATSVAPAKAWAAGAGGAQITGVVINGYSDPVAGQYFSDNTKNLSYTVTPATSNEDMGWGVGWYNAADPTEYAQKFEAGKSYYLDITLMVDTDKSDFFNPSIGVADVSIPGATVASVKYSTSKIIFIKTAPYAVPEDEPTTYKMTKGNGTTWFKGSTTGLTFVSEAPFEEFRAPFGAVVIDDEAIDAEYYTAETGSTKITLKPEYLQTLTPKKYRISIASENGVAQGTFTVKAAPTGYDGDADEQAVADDKTGASNDKISPKTGVETAPLAATTLGLAIGALAAGAYIFRTRKEGLK